MTTITGTVVNEEGKLRERIAALQSQVFELSGEVRELRSENPSPSWMQSKVARQAKALARLNKRVRVQRLILRELNEHHSEIAETLFRMVSDKYASELDDEISLLF